MKLEEYLRLIFQGMPEQVESLDMELYIKPNAQGEVVIADGLVNATKVTLTVNRKNADNLVK